MLLRSWRTATVPSGNLTAVVSVLRPGLGRSQKSAHAGKTEQRTTNNEIAEKSILFHDSHGVLFAKIFGLYVARRARTDIPRTVYQTIALVRT